MRINWKWAGPNWPLLSLLRFVLAMVVVAEHLTVMGHPNVFRQIGATAAVYAFFAISGFSIAHSITQEPVGYLRRRFWRIYPVYLVAVLLSYVPFFIKDVIELPNGAPTAPSSLHFFLSFLPFQGVIMPPLETNPALWSLGVEECLYLLAPLLLKLSRERAFYLLIVSALLYLLNPNSTTVPLYSVPLLAWAWLSGWVVYHERENRSLLMVLAAIMAACCYAFPYTHGKYGIVTGTVAFLLLAFQRRFSIPNRLHGVLQYAGDLSFPVYVCHTPVFIIVFLMAGPVHPIMYLVAALVVSCLVLHLVDKPLRARGRMASRSAVDKKRVPNVELSPVCIQAGLPN